MREPQSRLDGDRRWIVTLIPACEVWACTEVAIRGGSTKERKDMMDAVFWWTGAFVWAAIAAVLARLVGEIAVGFACACSWCRWSYRVMKAHGRKPNWKGLPGTFFSMWFDLIGHRNNGSKTWSGSGGHWYGICDSRVYPASDDAQGDEEIGHGEAQGL